MYGLNHMDRGETLDQFRKRQNDTIDSLIENAGFTGKYSRDRLANLKHVVFLSGDSNAIEELAILLDRAAQLENIS